jgi:phage-related protein
MSKVQNIIQMLETLNHELRMPYSKSLGKGLFELRITGPRHIRIIYTFHNNQILLLNIFMKKTWAIPRHEIEYAQNILKLYLA